MKTRLLFLSLTLLVIACAPPQRYGMVKQRDTGLMYGAHTSGSFVMDPDQFENNALKVTVRNTSGDTQFTLHSFKKQLEQAYLEKGYRQAQGKDFGIKVDVNVTYSGQLSQNAALEYGLIGGVAGGIAGGVMGQSSSNNMINYAVAPITGATAGAILGSYVTDDTYLVVTKVTVGIIRHKVEHKKTTIVFDSSKHKERKEPFKRYDAAGTITVAVYGGGRNIYQEEIVQEVRKRIKLILQDII